MIRRLLFNNKATYILFDTVLAKVETNTGMTFIHFYTYPDPVLQFFLFMASNPRQCALDKCGNLKDTKHVVRHHSEIKDILIGASNKSMIVISSVESQALTILISKYCVPASCPNLGRIQLLQFSKTSSRTSRRSTHLIELTTDISVDIRL